MSHLHGLFERGGTPVTAARLHVEGDLPEFEGVTAWLNTEPLTPAGLRGRVVLVDFCTYTCINWIRSLPYVRAWADTYAGEGLVVIGAHTPEFGFEHDLDNVRRALKEMDVRYPVAVDNEYAVWHAFDNHYWPALYFVDAEGRVRHHHFGEGDYEASERVLQLLLAEAGRTDVVRAPVVLEPQGVEQPADWGTLESPETYVGYRQADGFASPGGLRPDAGHVYAEPASLGRNQWALSGEWRVGPVAASVQSPGGTVSYGFHARDVHLVMGPATPQRSVRFRVTLDGRPPAAAHGIDVAADGSGVVTDQRLYQLVRQTAPIVERRFAIEFLDPGAELFVFTFG